MDESQISAAMAEREMLMGELRMMEAAAERGEAERASRQEMVHDLERMAAEAHDSDGAGSAGAEGREGGGVRVTYTVARDCSQRLPTPLARCLVAAGGPGHGMPAGRPATRRGESRR